MRPAARLWAVGLAAAAAALALPAGAAATTDCNFGVIPGNPAPTLVVTHTAGTGTVLLRVVPPAGVGLPLIAVSEDGAAVLCGGLAATTDQVAVIRYTNTGGSSDLVIQDPGAFSPGVASIDIGPQIKMLATATAGSLGNVTLRDTDGLADHFEFGDANSAGLISADVNPDSLVTDLDLFFATTSTTFTVEGSPQPDVVTASGFTSILSTPFPRSMTLIGGGGADTLTGGAANDVLRPGPGDDVVDGGGGRDLVDYSASTAGVDIDLTRPGAQAGGSLGRDTLAAVEDLAGSPFADVLRGGPGPNALDGGAGDDLIQGRGGDDTFTGGPGTDTLSFASATAPVTVDAGLTVPQLTGGAGVVVLTDAFEGLVGGAGADVLRGTAGPDAIDGGPGSDTVTALGGNDRVLLRDGVPDTADCGAGDDRAEVDPGGIDVVTACETVATGVAPGLPGAGGGAAGGGGSAMPGRHRVLARLAGAKRQALVRGAVVVKVACPALSCAARASAVATLKAGKRVRKVTLRTTRARLTAGAVARLRLGLPATGLATVRAALADGRHPVVRVVVVVTDAAAGTRTLRRAVTLIR